MATVVIALATFVLSSRANIIRGTLTLEGGEEVEEGKGTIDSERNQG